MNEHSLQHVEQQSIKDINNHFEDFIDIHTHILPGLDDGPANIQGSIAMAHCFVNAGIKAIIATPHYLHGTAWAASRDQVLTAVENLQEHLDTGGIDLQVQAGMEIANHSKMVEKILNGKLLALGESNYFLIEPSQYGTQCELFDNLSILLSMGKKCILAHPERVEYFQQEPDTLKDLSMKGVLFQVNAGSLLGYFGRRSKKTAEKMWKNDCIHFIASDAHDHLHRPPVGVRDLTRLAYQSGGGINLVSCIGHTVGCSAKV